MSLLAPLLLALCLAEGSPQKLPERATGSWLGVRPRLEERGLSLEGYYTLDSSHILAGSRAAVGSTALRGLFEIYAELELERVNGWEGATIGAAFQALHGMRGDRLTGDLQTFDNIDEEPFVGLAEVWFEQRALDDRLRLKVGRIETNAEFASTETSPLPRSVRARRPFMHSSMGFSPTIQRFGSYPNQALGALLEGKPRPWFRIVGGAFDATLRPSLLSTREPELGDIPFAATLLISEVEMSWRTKSVHFGGSMTFGGWGLVGETSCDAPECQLEPAGGPYAIFNQNLLREHARSDQGLAMFLQYGWSSPEQREFVHHVGAGLAWTGAIPTRDADVFGAGVTWADIDDSILPAGASEGETAVELFYRVALFPFMTLRPDLMILVDPGGVYPDAVVGTLRLSIDL